MMHLLKALNSFSTRRIARLALPNIVALKDACAGFEGAGSFAEDSEDRVRRILASFTAGQAISLDRRDIRFITAAIGSSELIGPSEVGSILTEVERRHDKRLTRAAFRALLASYREQSARSLIRAFVSRHVNALQPDARRFCQKSGILEGDAHLEELGRNLFRNGDINGFCVSEGLINQTISKCTFMRRI